MASDAIIIQQIDRTVQGKYQDWIIGITNDAAARKAELGNPLNWVQWEADSEREALKVQRHFVRKGIHRDTGGVSQGNIVYISLVP